MLIDQEQRFYDVLLKAGWLEDVVTQESTNDERMIQFRTGTTPLDDGKYRLWLFSKLCRELADGGLETAADMAMVIQMGAKFGLEERWE